MDAPYLSVDDRLLHELSAAMIVTGLAMANLPEERWRNGGRRLSQEPGLVNANAAIVWRLDQPARRGP
jgi:hypothetical protein